MCSRILAPSHPVEWHNWGSCGLALPPGRGLNTRCGVMVLLLERVIAQGVPMVATRQVDVTGEVAGDVDRVSPEILTAATVQCEKLRW